MADATVPSSSRCRKAASAPPSESKRTDERRGARDSMSTTCSSGPMPSGGIPRTAGSRRPDRRAAPGRTAPPSAGRWRCRPVPRCSRPPAPRAGRRAGRGRRTGWSRRGPAAPRRARSPSAGPARRRWAGSRARVRTGARSPAWRPRRDRGPCPRTERDRRLRDAGAARHVDARHAGVGGGGDGGHATTPEGAGVGSIAGAPRHRRGQVWPESQVIRSMLIRMTTSPPPLPLSPPRVRWPSRAWSPRAPTPCAAHGVVIDAPAARDGRALVDPRLRAVAPTSACRAARPRPAPTCATSRPWAMTGSSSPARERRRPRRPRGRAGADLAGALAAVRR